MATTYILRCADNKLYVGSTTNIDERLKRHNAGYASEYTHLHRPVELVYKEEYDTYQEAFRRERQLKKWTLAKKEALIAGDIEKLKEIIKIKRMNAVHSEFIDATASTGSALLLTSFDDAELPELVEGPGDVPVTYADSTALERDFGFTPKITLREGLRKFAEWYKEFYR